MELNYKIMKQHNTNNLTQTVVLLNKKGQIYFKKAFFFKSIKKFYRFTVLEVI